MKKIKLTQNKTALVDNDDFEELNKFKWYANRHGNTFYAVRSLANGSKRLMHRCILNTPTSNETDHKDGNGLNNQRKNLRICNHSENQQNKGKNINNTSGFKGISWCQRNKKWLVRLSVNGTRLYLGHFKQKIKAYQAYVEACIKYHGNFSKTK